MPLRPALSGTAVLLLALLFVGWLWSAATVVWWGRHDDGTRAEAIVVLGAAQYRGRPSPVLKARLDHAIALYERGVAPYVVFTGGTGPGDTTSEAAVSRHYARRRGLPDSAILLETEGRTSSESLRAVAEILAERGIDTVVFVSDPFHMARLRVVGRRLGLVPRTSPTRTSPIQENRELAWAYVFGESMKVPLAYVTEEGRE